MTLYPMYLKKPRFEGNTEHTALSTCTVPSELATMKRFSFLFCILLAMVSVWCGLPTDLEESFNVFEDEIAAVSEFVFRNVC